MDACIELCGTWSCILAWLDSNLTFSPAWISALIALAALIVTGSNLRETLKQNKRSLRPKLFPRFDPVERDNDREANHDELSLSLYNYGLGPALLQSIEIRSDGRTLDVKGGELDTVLDQIFPNRIAQWQSTHQQVGEYAIQKDGKLDLARVYIGRPAREDDFATLARNLTMVIRYRSVHDETIVDTWPPAGVPLNIGPWGHGAA